MIRRIQMLLIIPLILLFSGCALVNLSLTPGSQALKEQEIEGRGTPKILIIDVTGMISEKGQEQMLLGSTKPSMVAQIHEALQKAESEANLAGLIIRINSPGGTVTASDIIHHDIVRFKALKRVPVYACITGIGASANDHYRIGLKMPAIGGVTPLVYARVRTFQADIPLRNLENSLW